LALLASYIRTGIIHDWDAQTVVLGRRLKEGFQGVPHPGPEGHGCCALRGAVGSNARFVDAEELSAKAILAVKLNELIRSRGLSQTEAAAITGMTQPKVSQVGSYKLQNISLERLMQALVSFDQQVEITVKPARRAHVAGITVAA
jgi:predicted XRE-type DNA-binding protein